jgi:hypothetical protein
VSRINGDKAKFNKERKKKAAHRHRMLELRRTLATGAAAGASAPKSAAKPARG